MKIEHIKIGEDDVLSLQEIFCNTVIETKEKNRIAICMRDDTIELSVVGSNRWYRANIETGSFEEI